jgi:cytochrome c-type biogenesis protein CcmE
MVIVVAAAAAVAAAADVMLSNLNSCFKLFQQPNKSSIPFAATGPAGHYNIQFLQHIPTILFVTKHC